jgi:hypothetical protein
VTAARRNCCDTVTLPLWSHISTLHLGPVTACLLCKIDTNLMPLLPAAGFVGADLMALVKEAAALAVTRIFSSLIPAPAPGAPGSSSSSSQAGGPEGGSAPPVPQAQRPQLTAGVGGVTIAQAAAAAAAASSEAGSAAPSPQFGGGPLTPAQLAGLAITMSDFETAVSKVQPSVRREGFTTRPDVTWEDVGSLDEVREGEGETQGVREPHSGQGSNNTRTGFTECIQVFLPACTRPQKPCVHWV